MRYSSQKHSFTGQCRGAPNMSGDRCSIKYSPGHSAWSQNYYDSDEFDDLTEQQKRMLMPPSIGQRPDVVQEK